MHQFPRAQGIVPATGYLGISLMAIVQHDQVRDPADLLLQFYSFPKQQVTITCIVLMQDPAPKYSAKIMNNNNYIVGVLNSGTHSRLSS